MLTLKRGRGSTLGRLGVAVLTIVASTVAATARPDQALAARGMLIGLYDPVQPIIAPEKTFETYSKLRVQVMRMDLNWGTYVAKTRPANAADPTDPHGNNKARGSRPSIAPLTFLSALKRYGLRHFDVYAHHPYYSHPGESPTMRPKAKTTVTLGNINVLIHLLTRLYGHKQLWITEYGYQTRPPDRHFGVSLRTQARYLTKAYAVARRNPRISMMLWFLLRDERRLSGWQSGLLTASGKPKPAFNAFRRLRH